MCATVMTHNNNNNKLTITTLCVCRFCGFVVSSGKEEMEPYDQDCNCVKVWHTKTSEPDTKEERHSPSSKMIEV